LDARRGFGAGREQNNHDGKSKAQSLATADPAAGHDADSRKGTESEELPVKRFYRRYNPETSD
jgi:hypothetical protein